MVFTDAAKRIILYEKNLDILSHVELNPRDPDSTLPSWVPDWNDGRAPSMLLYAPDVITRMTSLATNIKQCDFSAAGNQPLSVTFARHTTSGLSQVLCVKGVIVARLTNPDTLEERKHNYTNLLSEWNAIAVGVDWPYFLTGETIEEVQLQIFCKGIFNQILDAEMGDSDFNAGEVAQEFFSDTTQEGWRYFRSPAGYLGVARPQARPTDLICILFGASVPCVLRRRDDGYYTFMGEAYVHGIMEGYQKIMW